MNPGAIYTSSRASSGAAPTLEMVVSNSNSMVLPENGSRPLHFIWLLVYTQHTHKRASVSDRKQAKKNTLKTHTSSYSWRPALGTTDNRFPRRAGLVCQSRGRWPPVRL